MPIMPLRLGHSALCPVITLLLAGFVTTLTPLPVCGDSISEVLAKLHSIRTEATSLPQDGSSCYVPHRVLFDSRTHLHHFWFCSQPFFMRVHFVFQERQWKAQLRVSLLRRVLVKLSHTTCGILSWNCCFTGRLAASSYSLLMKSTWPKLHSLCHFSLDLLCYKVLTVLHVASSGTITRGSVSIGVAPLSRL